MESIGRHVAAHLRSLPNLTEEQKKQLDEFDNRNLKDLTDEQKANRIAYNEKIKMAYVPKSEIVIEKKDFWPMFKYNYFMSQCVDFNETKETIDNIEPVIKYFLQDESFKDCKNVSHQFNPSLKKGLLIIGGYGNGKSSVMEAIRLSLQNYGLSFAFRNMNDVVTDYEACEDQTHKKTFWHYVTSGNCCFDDVKTESEASNFGKVNLFKSIIEKRYLNKDIKTHLTCNYSDSFPYDLEKGLDEFGEKYGGRVYDRMTEMFNVIEFKGKSMRK